MLVWLLMTQFSRRTFVQMAAAGLSAAASDRLQVGFIGLGGQGTSRLNEFLRHADVDAAAVCDADQTHADRASAIVEKARGRKPEVYRDFRKLLERKDLDAVMVATPDHWHALPHDLCVPGRARTCSSRSRWPIRSARDARW